ncbi:MAG: hypothetical protein ACHQ49_07325 [Elusimicrobiota bacterium]
MRRYWTSVLLLVAGGVLIFERGMPRRRVVAASEAPAPTLQAAPPAPPAAGAAPPAAAKKGAGCTAAAPRPSLLREDYRSYSFEFGPDNTAIEKGSAEGVDVEIQYSGCYDGVEHGFLFEQGDAPADYADRDHWLAFAADQLKGLKIYRRAQTDVDDLVPFLTAAKKATTRMNDSELRLELCRDGSKPTEDGCSFESGGGWRFATRKLGEKRVGVYVSRYSAL